MYRFFKITTRKLSVAELGPQHLIRARTPRLSLQKPYCWTKDEETGKLKQNSFQWSPIEYDFHKALSSNKFDDVLKFRDKYASRGFSPNIPFYLYPRFVSLMAENEIYNITEERLMDQLFYKDCSLLFDLYRYTFDIGSYLCRASRPVFNVDVSKDTVHRYNTYDRNGKLVKGSELRRMWKGTSINHKAYVQSPNSKRHSQSLVYFYYKLKSGVTLPPGNHNIDKNELEDMKEAVDNFALSNFDRFEKNYSQTFRLPVFLLPRIEFEDDYFARYDYILLMDHMHRSWRRISRGGLVDYNIDINGNKIPETTQNEPFKFHYIIRPSGRQYKWSNYSILPFSSFCADSCTSVHSNI